MTIKVGDQIPSMKLMMGTPEGPKETSTDEIFKGKKVVLFAVPGAFTPTCSVKHLPSFVQNADALKAKGVDTIACIAVNDAFVMAAWGKEQGTDGKITMLADGSAAFTKALGLELDLMGRGMGTRSQRYALIAQDGKVTHLAVEAPGGFEVSKAESILHPTCQVAGRGEGAPLAPSRRLHVMRVRRQTSTNQSARPPPPTMTAPATRHASLVPSMLTCRRMRMAPTIRKTAISARPWVIQ